MATDCILIFDVGKTNKKVIVFDRQYKVILEQSSQLGESVDEERFPCEDVGLLTQWIQTSFNELITDPRFKIKAVNISAYGASFVCVDKNLKPVSALSNYLKPYPATLQENLHKKYGGKELFSRTTASPALGSLNSGLQLYRQRQENPERFKKIHWALHLPQYLSAVLTGEVKSEMTSIGCHTSLWDFTKQDYHTWVRDETIEAILPEISAGDDVSIVEAGGQKIPVGVGLHDSSAALIPYLICIDEPFILLSTGTWNISLNPFNSEPLTDDELIHDCLCYLSYEGKPVKASRFFAGHEHDIKVKALAEKFSVAETFFLDLRLDQSGILNSDESAAIAYLDLMNELLQKQAASLNLALGKSQVNKIFVDGGFSKNSIFMHLLAKHFPSMKVYAAAVPQASALGAAIAIHSRWNSTPLPHQLVELREIKNNTMQQ